MPRIINIFSLFLLHVILFSCQLDGRKEEDDSPREKNPDSVVLSNAQAEMAGITLGGTVKRNMSGGIKANGIVDVPPQYVATVSVPVNGFIKSTEVLIGDHVHKGGLLAVLYHPDYILLQQKYLEARNRLIFLEKELKRQKDLSEENISARKNLEQTEAEFQAGYAQVKALEAQLEILGISAAQVSEGNIVSSVKLKSPIAGDVAVVNSAIGKLAQPGEVLFEVVNKEHIHIELMVYEKDVLQVRKGQKINYTVAGNPKILNATVVLTGKKLDAANRTVRIHAHPDGDEDLLLPGMYVNAKILTDEKTTVVLPEEALIREGGQEFIFIKVQGTESEWTFTRFPVRTGLREGGFVEVFLPEELAREKNIVNTGAYFLASEMRKVDED